MEAAAYFVGSAVITAGAVWLFCVSLTALLEYWSRRISVGTLYLQNDREYVEMLESKVIP